MNIYAHDYTLAEQADKSLYEARLLFSRGSYSSATQKLNDARDKLLKYLTSDNLVEGYEYFDGMIKARDTFNEEQMVFIRDIFAERLHAMQGYGATQQDMLDVINVVQRATGCDEYMSLDEFRNDDSGTFTER